MNELSRHISVLNVGDEGTLSLAKEIPYHVEGAMEDDVQNGAEITLAADGKTLYASVRNYNRTGAMLVFSVHGGFESSLSQEGRATKSRAICNVSCGRFRMTGNCLPTHS